MYVYNHKVFSLLTAYPHLHSYSFVRIYIHIHSDVRVRTFICLCEHSAHGELVLEIRLRSRRPSLYTWCSQTLTNIPVHTLTLLRTGSRNATPSRIRSRSPPGSPITGTLYMWCIWIADLCVKNLLIHTHAHECVMSHVRNNHVMPMSQP